MPFRVSTPVKRVEPPAPAQSVPKSNARVSLAIESHGTRPPLSNEGISEPHDVSREANLADQISANPYGDNRLPEIESNYQSLLQPLPGRTDRNHAFEATSQPSVPSNRVIPDELQHFEPTQSSLTPITHPPAGAAPGSVEPPRLQNGLTQRLPPTTSHSADSIPSVARRNPASGWASRQAPVRTSRTYRLRDGDTLRELAGRFLGDPNRAGEILQLNRDLIRHPEILPLGVEIRIPTQ